MDNSGRSKESMTSFMASYGQPPHSHSGLWLNQKERMLASSRHPYLLKTVAQNKAFPVLQICHASRPGITRHAFCNTGISLVIVSQTASRSIAPIVDIFLKMFPDCKSLMGAKMAVHKAFSTHFFKLFSGSQSRHSYVKVVVTGNRSPL